MGMGGAVTAVAATTTVGGIIAIGGEQAGGFLFEILYRFVSLRPELVAIGA